MFSQKREDHLQAGTTSHCKIVIRAQFLEKYKQRSPKRLSSFLLLGKFINVSRCDSSKAGGRSIAYVTFNVVQAKILKLFSVELDARSRVPCDNDSLYVINTILF